jgi:L-threonylcarbamoyladenylate synthase
MLGRHYAPAVPLEAVAANARALAASLAAQAIRVGWLSLPHDDADNLPGVVNVRMPDDPDRYAAALYDSLHTLEAEGVERIVVSLPPDAPAWLAVRDRLRRAGEQERM